MTLDATEQAPAISPRPTPRRVHAAMLAAGVVAAFAIGFVVHQPPAPEAHTVEFGLSAYPAAASAWWVGSDRAVHASLPWADRVTVVGMRAAGVAVANTDGAPVSCTLTVDGQTVDSQIANRQGDVAVCVWKP